MKEMCNRISYWCKSNGIARARGPETGVVLEPMKILVPTEDPAATKWFKSIGIEVVEVECPSLVGPRNSGSIHCAAGSIIGDPEPKSYQPLFNLLRARV